jgi:hypothetical protein
MKRLAIAVLAVCLIAAPLGFYWVVPRQKDAGVDHIEKVSRSGVKSSTFSFKITGGEVDYNGKKTSFAIRGEEGKDVEIKLAPSAKFHDGQLDATFLVTIKNERPPVLTKEAYEKIQNGMTYPQVGEALGGVMTKGQMSDGFSSKLELDQGTRQILLTFVDGKVTEKSAKELE